MDLKENSIFSLSVFQFFLKYSKQDNFTKNKYERDLEGIITMILSFFTINNPDRNCMISSFCIVLLLQLSVAEFISIYDD